MSLIKFCVPNLYGFSFYSRLLQTLFSAYPIFCAWSCDDNWYPRFSTALDDLPTLALNRVYCLLPLGCSPTDVVNHITGRRLATVSQGGRVSASQLEGWVFVPLVLSESPQRSLGKSAHRNRPDKTHYSGFGLPPVVVK